MMDANDIDISRGVKRVSDDEPLDERSRKVVQPWTGVRTSCGRSLAS